MRQPTSMLKKRAPGCLVWTKPYTPLEVTRIRSVSPSFEKSSQIKTCVGGPGNSIVANILPPGDIITASCSPAARIISWLSCNRKGRGLSVGTTRPPSIIPDGEGRFDHVTPVDCCHCQIASWPCKPGEYDVICKKHFFFRPPISVSIKLQVILETIQALDKASPAFQNIFISKGRMQFNPKSSYFKRFNNRFF